MEGVIFRMRRDEFGNGEYVDSQIATLEGIVLLVLLLPKLLEQSITPKPGSWPSIILNGYG